MNESSEERIREDGDTTVIVTEIQWQKSLVEGCLAGDASAWETFWAAFEGPLLKCIRREFRRRGTCVRECTLQEIAQDGLVALWNPAHPRLRDCNFQRGNINLFLRVLSKSLVVLHVRREKRRQQRERPLGEFQPLDDHGPEWEIQIVLEEVLVRLTPRERAAVLAFLGETPLPVTAQPLSSSNTWKLAERIRKKIAGYRRGEQGS